MKIIISLKQHVGAPCKPIVGIGDRLSRGQLIAVPDGLGANIHSSVSGEVIKIDTDIHILADEIQSEDFIKIKETARHLEMIREAGVVGAGGAGFPTAIKLGTKLLGGCVIVNAAECEPLLAHNIAYIERQADVMIRGLNYLIEICDASYGYIAIKPKHKKALIALANASKKAKNIEIKLLPDMYPAGDERVIVRELLGIEMKPGELPSVYKAVIVNAETLKNCVLAIEERRPVITKDFTVAGKVKDGSKVFFDRPIGMPVDYFIDESGGLANNSGELVIGGPFTGKRAKSDAVISKVSGGILVGVEFPNDARDFGILECECGASKERLSQIVESMGGRVVASERCKRMVEVNGRYRCDKPGECPGQAQSVLKLKAGGARVIITGTCED